MWVIYCKDDLVVCTISAKDVTAKSDCYMMPPPAWCSRLRHY